MAKQKQLLHISHNLEYAVLIILRKQRVNHTSKKKKNSALNLRCPKSPAPSTETVQIFQVTRHGGDALAHFVGGG